MAHRYSPSWDLRKKGPRFNPSGLQVKFPPAHFPIYELDLGVCHNGFVRFGLLVLCVVLQKKNIGN